MRQQMEWIRNNWVLVFILGLIVSLFFNESFRLTLSRHRSIAKAQIEYALLSSQNDVLARKIQRLENHPATYELLVRENLGYLRPGEKEVRFLKTKEIS